MWVVTKETPDEFSSNVLPFYKQQQQKISSKNHGIINGWSLVHPAKETSMFEPLIYSVGLTLEQCVVVHSSIKQLASLLHCTRSLHNHPPLPHNPLPHTLHRNVSSNTLSTVQLWKWFIFTEPTMTSFHNIWSMKGAVTAKVKKI